MLFYPSVVLYVVVLMCSLLGAFGWTVRSLNWFVFRVLLVVSVYVAFRWARVGHWAGFADGGVGWWFFSVLVCCWFFLLGSCFVQWVCVEREAV